MHEKKPAVVALGMFDGMHIGHRALINKTLQLADSLQARSVVYTFANHPRSVFSSAAPKLLMSADERKFCMLNMGVQEVEMEIFDHTIAALQPNAYIGRLMARHDIRAVVVGFNYTFGDGGKGTPETLRALGREMGFAVEVIPSVMFLGEAVSSTRIRELIDAGDIQGANEMLCAPYTISGQVMPNKRIGGSIGYPTANLFPPPEKVLPKSGVYVASANWNGKEYPAVTNVGNNPTVEGKIITVETHLLDFMGDLYGETIAVRFHEYVRGECKFPNKEELAAQIQRDVERARAWFLL